MNKSHTASRFLAACAVVAVAFATSGDARGDGVAQVLTAKKIPAATVAVIDPESGTSTGGGSGDVRINVGDIILFRFEYFPVPDKIVRGLQGYLTEYIPLNTEVVGVRLMDKSGATIRPRYPGIATDACGAGCNGFNSVPWMGGARNLADGSISQVYADTGIFYTTDTGLLRDPGNTFLTLENGALMSPEPRSIGAVKSLVGVTGLPYAHNSWDWVQVLAYGIAGSASGNDGTGNTPLGYGSPVAGPETWHRYEATEVMPSVIEFNDVVGPWQRIASPGSQVGFCLDTGGLPTSVLADCDVIPSSGPLRRMNMDTSSGFDLTPLAPLPWSNTGGTTTTAVRIAMGEVRVGEPGFAEVALRVKDVPLDSVQGDHVDCSEVFGGDTSAKSATVRARDNSWPVYLASPACVFLRLLFELDNDTPLAQTGDTVTYTVRGKNLSTDPQTNVVVKVKYDSTRAAFVSATGGPTAVSDCDGDGLDCLVWPPMTVLPSGEYTFDAVLDISGGGQVTNVVFANYTSAEIVTPGFTTQSISMSKGVAVVAATLDTTLDATTTAAMAGGTIALSGTVENNGSTSGGYDTLTIFLPSGWTVCKCPTVPIYR